MKAIVLLIFLLVYSNIFAYEEEDKIVCAITSKVAKFTQKNNPNIDPYRISILNNKYGDLFTNIFKDIKINNKKVEISYIDDIHDLKESNVLFIFDTPIDELNEVFSFIKGKRLLTISTIRGFADRGGMVQIYSQNQKLKLKINLDKVLEEDIYISSALLRLAEIIKGDKND